MIDDEKVANSMELACPCSKEKKREREEQQRGYEVERKMS
jgi:hypothetical protein